MLESNDDDAIDLKQVYMSTLSKIDHVPKSKWYYYRDLMNDHDFGRTAICPNRAFYKLWEILKRYPLLIPQKRHANTCHLAEAPGSFIKVVQSIMQAPNSVAISKPRCEGDHTPIFHKELYKNRHVKLVYGDLLDKSTRDEFINHYKGFDLVTADGGIDEKVYQDKEPMHYELLFAEAITVLNVQAVNGNLIFKFFESFTETTLKILHMITQHYAYYTITKPKTSRPTNSERYLLCRGYKGLSINVPRTLSELVSTISVPMATRKYITIHNNKLIREQIKIINITLSVIHGQVHIDTAERMQNKKKAYETFYLRYGLGEVIKSN